MSDQKDFKPFVPAETNMKELTVKAIVMGCLFGIINILDELIRKLRDLFLIGSWHAAKFPH